MSVQVRRLPIQLLPDATRVITRFFGPGEENRIRDIVGRLLAVSETAVAALVANLELDSEHKLTCAACGLTYSCNRGSISELNPPR